MTNPRYDGKPFLRLLECYIQRALGALGDVDAEVLARMTPHLRSTFKHEGEWHEIVAAQMELDAEFDRWLAAEWDRAREAGVAPAQFSELVADKLVEG